MPENSSDEITFCFEFNEKVTMVKVSFYRKVCMQSDSKWYSHFNNRKRFFSFDSGGNVRFL